MWENAEDLHITVLMYNLLDFSDNYSITSESLKNSYWDEINFINDNSWEAKSFKCKVNLIGKAVEQVDADDDGKRANVSSVNVESFIMLKYLSNFGDLFI